MSYFTRDGLFKSICAKIRCTEARDSRTPSNRNGAKVWKEATKRCCHHKRCEKLLDPSILSYSGMLKVTLLLKDVAINMLSERYYIPTDFENYLKFVKFSKVWKKPTKPLHRRLILSESVVKIILEDYLLALANYFYWFFEEADASKRTNPVCM